MGSIEKYSLDASSGVLKHDHFSIKWHLFWIHLRFFCCKPQRLNSEGDSLEIRGDELQCWTHTLLHADKKGRVPCFWRFDPSTDRARENMQVKIIKNKRIFLVICFNVLFLFACWRTNLAKLFRLHSQLARPFYRFWFIIDRACLFIKRKLFDLKCCPGKNVPPQGSSYEGGRGMSHHGADGRGAKN